MMFRSMMSAVLPYLVASSYMEVPRKRESYHYAPPAPISKFVRRERKPCLLESCGKMHSHNNSWCSPEHCREWRASHPFNGKGRP